MRNDFVLLAGLVVAAMSACTKTEGLVDHQAEATVSFKPLTAKVTKADYITNESIDLAPSNFLFNVYAWYNTGLGNFVSDDAVEYMSNVLVKYDSTIDDGTTDGNGAWKPGETYYWPKNGTLTFDAYAPSSASADGTFSSTAANGLEFKNYTVKGLDDQYDLLYSSRTYNKTTSTNGTNSTYDGVDIVFNHALSAIEVKVKTTDDYNGYIKLKNVSVLNAYNKGTFNQNYKEGYAEASVPSAWTGHEGNVSYELFNDNAGVILTSDALASVKNAIVLPQKFDHQTGKVSIKVDYSIKHGKKWLDQTLTFDLEGLYDQDLNVINEWEIGKRYIYTIKFALEKIYFAPSVNPWTDVTMGGIVVH